MTEQNLITPPPELVEQWHNEGMLGFRDAFAYRLDITAQAASWAADQELDACCEWLKAKEWIHPGFSDELRAARRPKPPSLAEQSLALIDKIQRNKEMWDIRDLDVVRRVLGRLQELENND